MTAPAHLVKGGDPVLVDGAVRDLLARVGEGSVEEVEGSEYPLDRVLEVANSPGMFEHRIGVIRHLGRFSTAELEPLLEWIAHPLPGCTLILVWERPPDSSSRLNPVPKKLLEGVTGAGGEVRDAGVPGGKAASAWLDAQLDEIPVRFTPGARRLVHERLGEDRSAVLGLGRVLAGAFADSARIDAEDLRPYLTETGGVPPWDLTDALDRGRAADSVAVLRRMLAAGDRHPLQVFASLTNHVLAMVRLDGAGVRTDKEAATLLGMAPYPAKKALTSARRLGTHRLREASDLLARADADLRGHTGLPADLVLEMLVLRLAGVLGR